MQGRKNLTTFKGSRLPGFCQALIWIGGFGWGLSLFLVCASVLKFEYRQFQGVIATPAFLLYPEQKDLGLYVLALIIIPLTTILSYVIGRTIVALIANKPLISSSTFLTGWLVPLSYAYKPSMDWILLAFSLVLFVFINWVVYFQRTMDLLVLTLWLFSGAAVAVAGLTSPFADILLRQHPTACLLLCVGLGFLGYFCLRHKKVVEVVSLALLPLCLLPIHSLLWSVVYQGDRESLRQGSAVLVLMVDGILILLSPVIGFVLLALSNKGRNCGNYKKVLKGFLVYLVIPLMLYILAYNPNIHGPLDLFHEGERLSPAYAIAQGRAPYKEVVFIHGFIRDPGIGLAAFKIFGYSVVGLRTLERLIFPLVIVFSYYLALTCVGFEIATLYSLLTLIGFWPFFYDWRMIPLLLVLIALVAFIKNNKHPSFLSFLAGLGVSLALVTSVDVGIVGLVVGLAFFAVFSISARRANVFGFFLMSLIFCLLGLAIWLNQSGVLADCLKWNIHLLRVNSHWNGMPFPYPLDNWAKGVKAFLSPMASLLAITFLAVKWYRGKWENQHWVIFVLLIANIALYNRTIVGGQLYSSHIRDGSHFAPLLLMVLLFTEKEKFSRHLLAILFVGMLLIPTPMSSGQTLLNLLGKLPEKNRMSIPETWTLSEIPRIGPIFLPPEQNLWISEMVKFLSSVDSFWDFTDHGLLYFLSAHLSPARFYATHHIITVEDQQEVITALEQARPVFVLYRSGTGWDAIAGVDRTVRSFLVSEYLLKNYHFFRQIGGFVILERGAPDAFPQPLAFKVDLGYLPVLWAQNFPGVSYEDLRADSILNGWKPGQDMRLIETGGSELKLLTTGPDPWLERNVILNPRSVKYLLLRMRVNGTNGSRARIFWRSHKEEFTEERSLLFNLLPDGKEHLYLIPLASFPSWTWSDTITNLRFDPIDRPSAEVNIIELKILYSQ